LIRIVLLISCCALLADVCSGQTMSSPQFPPAPESFTHPGVLSSQAELDLIQKRIAAADPKDTTYAGYLSTMKTRYANLDYEPKPTARIERGDRKPVDGPRSMREAAMTAYTLTLKWAATGDPDACRKAQSIMAAWADTYEGSGGDINRFLDASWVLAPWCAAGELQQYAKYGGEGAEWPSEQVAKFKSMVRKLSDTSKQIFDPKYAPGNWQTSASLAAMAAGVFLDDAQLYRQGRDYQLKNIPRVLLKPGYANEIFRDPWHGMVSVTGLLEAAEVGRHQGDLSLFHAKYDGQSDPRLLVSLRWYANPLRGIPVDVPPMGGPKWKPRPWQFTAGGNAARSTGGWEIGLNFYKYIEPSPDLDQFEDAVIKSYRPSGQDNALFIESDSMTQGDLYKPGSRFTMHE
jgi:hypothetical protein